MELIEREETIKALVNEAKIIDGKRFEEPNLQHVFDFGGIIRSMPTVQAVPIEEVLKIIEFEEKWLSQTRMSIRDIDIAFDAMKSKIKQIEGSGEE